MFQLPSIISSVEGLIAKNVSDKTDFEDFLSRLGNLFEETDTTCYAWALLSNHFHLLLWTGNVPVSSVMKRLLTGYATRSDHRAEDMHMAERGVCPGPVWRSGRKCQTSLWAHLSDRAWPWEKDRI